MPTASECRAYRVRVPTTAQPARQAPLGGSAASYRGRMDTTDGMSDAEKRHDQLTAAPNATEADAKERILVTDHEGTTRIDIAEDAPVRPGDPRD